MDKVIAVRKHLIHKQWKAIIMDCHSSGMTTTAWCKANDISLLPKTSTFVYARF